MVALTIQDWHLLFLLPFGSAVTARLAYNRWQAWLGWGIVSLIGFLGLWHFGPSAEYAAGITGLSSVLGFLSPEIWEAIRSVARRPRTWAWIGGIVFGVYLLYNPEVAKGFLMLAAVIIACWLILRPIFSRNRRR